MALVRELGCDAISVQGDIAVWEDVRRISEEAVGHFGRIDVLVNNVGDMAASQMSWRELTPESVDHTLDLDIKGTLFMTHEVGRRMLDDQRSGAIVNIGSRVVVEGSPRAPQYAAAKYAIIGITKSYAHALAPHVRVNTLGPGFFLASDDSRHITGAFLLFDGGHSMVGA